MTTLCSNYCVISDKLTKIIRSISQQNYRNFHTVLSAYIMMKILYNVRIVAKKSIEIFISPSIQVSFLWNRILSRLLSWQIIAAACCENVLWVSTFCGGLWITIVKQRGCHLELFTQYQFYEKLTCSQISQLPIVTSCLTNFICNSGFGRENRAHNLQQSFSYIYSSESNAYFCNP